MFLWNFKGTQAYGLSWNLFGQYVYSKSHHLRSWCLNTWLMGFPQGYGHGVYTGISPLISFALRTAHYITLSRVNCHPFSHLSYLFRSSWRLVFFQSSIAVTVRNMIVSSANRWTWECLVHCGLVYACLDTCCSHYLTIIAGGDLHFRHESELPVCQTRGLNPGRRSVWRDC